jgi:hypothetical protein
MTIYLGQGEAEFWQQYESANECVIATAHAATPYARRRSPHHSRHRCRGGLEVLHPDNGGEESAVASNVNLAQPA